MTMTPRLIRTGTFRFVLFERIDEFHTLGWMTLADLGRVHGCWSVLMWRCDCEGGA